MMIIDIEDLDVSDDAYGDVLLEGEFYSGIAYGLHPETGVLVSLCGFRNGAFHGAARSWYTCGRMKAETFYSGGGYHGPLREWFEDGNPKSDMYWERRTTHRRKEWAEGGRLVKNTTLLPGTESFKRLEELHQKQGLRPIIDIDLETWEFVERPWGWGLDSAELPLPGPPPKRPVAGDR